MSPESIVSMLIVLGIIWGGFFYFANKASIAEQKKKQ